MGAGAGIERQQQQQQQMLVKHLSHVLWSFIALVAATLAAISYT